MTKYRLPYSNNTTASLMLEKLIIIAIGLDLLHWYISDWTLNLF